MFLKRCDEEEACFVFVSIVVACKSREGSLLLLSLVYEYAILYRYYVQVKICCSSSARRGLRRDRRPSWRSRAERTSSFAGGLLIAILVYLEFRLVSLLQ